jgi:acetolactate synthase I/III small subunit
MQEERITFVITAENRAELLARLMLLFHRLNVEIHALSMKRKRDSATMRLNVMVEVGEEHARRIEAHLYKVVEVTSIRIGRAGAKLAEEAFH